MRAAEPIPRTIFSDVGEALIRPRRPYGDLLREVALALWIDLPVAAIDGLAPPQTRATAVTTTALPTASSSRTAARRLSACRSAGLASSVGGLTGGLGVGTLGLPGIFFIPAGLCAIGVVGMLLLGPMLRQGQPPPMRATNHGP